ncbi:MAG: 23S rRNA (adenine(2503)-C(2))-methyltransferase RlmN [Candidatus Dojkabacteria bacterium]|nr:23S rRNA (adenine(2503)-C(2))-methyltransferase RlmN [Candidatus Dojkabacteria bacterium]
MLIYNTSMIEDFANTHKLPKYRSDQFNDQFYKQAINSFDELTTWPSSIREKLKKEVEFSTLDHIQDNYSSAGTTIKTEFKTKDGFPIESVLMQYKDGRNSVCVSCMSGCPVGCEFCATGKMGFNRNLGYREIVDQILYFKRMLKKKGKDVTNIVFMGMGEPMLNLDNVKKAIEIINDPEKMSIGIRRVTISTVGYVPQMEEFFTDKHKPKLAISLHAPNQNIREKIMPKISKLHPMEELFEFVNWYEKNINKRITYEYTLIKGINDQPEHAIELSKLLYQRKALVNVIRFNPSIILPFEKPNEETVQRFVKILNNRDIKTTIRYSMGDKIGGACGQLHSFNSLNS